MKYLIILSAIATAAACTPSNAEDSKDGKDSKDGLKFVGSITSDEIDSLCVEHYSSEAWFALADEIFEDFKETSEDNEFRVSSSFCETDLYSHRCIRDELSHTDGSVESRDIIYEQLIAPDGTILGSSDEVEYGEEACIEDRVITGSRTVWQAAPFPD